MTKTQFFRLDTSTLLKRNLQASVLSALPAIFLFMLAAYLRLEKLWLVQFKFDEAMLADKALSFVEGRYIPLAGNSSAAGVMNPPAFVYLISIPLKLWPHPVAVSAFLALLGAVAVIVLYLLGRLYFHRSVAFAAALLYAVNPWANWFTRSIWEPDAVHLFVMLFFLALYAFAISGRRWALALSTVALTLMTGIHFSTVVFLPVYLLGLLIGRRSFAWRPFLVGITISLLMYVPYLYGDYLQGWHSLRALLAQPTAGAVIDADALRYSGELINGFGYFLPDDLAGDGPGDAIRLFALRNGEALLVGLGLICSLWLVLRGRFKTHPSYLLLLIWVAVPIVMSTRHWLNLQVHYFLTILPALCLLAGVGAGVVGSGVRRVFPRVMPGVLLALFILAVGYSQMFAYESQLGRLSMGDRTRFSYGVPIRYTSQLANYITAAGYREVRVLAPSGDLAAALDSLLRDRVSIANFDSRFALPLPPEGGAIYVVLEDGSSSANFLSRAASSYLVDSIKEGDQPIYSIYGLPETKAEDLLGSEFAPTYFKFENGPVMLGSRIPRKVDAGDAFEVATLWNVDSRPNAEAPALISFAHLIDSENHGLAEAYEYGHSPSTVNLSGGWISWLKMRVPTDVPEGPFQVDYGLFYASDQVPVQVYDRNDRLVGQRVTLGPFRVDEQGLPKHEPEHLLNADFAGLISLGGYDIIREEASELRVSLHWRSTGSPANDYQGFVHLVDAMGRLVAQQDQRPAALPTSLWEAGDEFVSTYVLKLPADLKEGRYRIVTGLYQLSDGKRVQFVAGASSTPGDAVVLTEITSP